ncbi:MAG: acetoin utilization protein AcuC [Bacillota bacterium]|nr:acetoin utilization protein AcuC [Bacillota bacterium]
MAWSGHWDSDRVALVWSRDLLSYRFGPDHPFDSRRLELLVDLLESAGLLRPHDLLPPREASAEELRVAHESAYLEALERMSRSGEGEPGAAERFGLGTEDNPVFPGMAQAAAWVAGGALEAADAVGGGRFLHVFHPAGGLHHAQRGRASGFCLVNDAVLAVERLRRRWGMRVAYVDIDAHHADGVQAAFYEAADVLVVSLHETGRYLFPGTGSIDERGRGAGAGRTWNVPLDAYTEDASWIEAFRRVVPPLLERFAPDVLVSQHGADGHRLDPLTHLALTTESYRAAGESLHRLAHELCDGRWLALGGGGYAVWEVVPRVWALLWSEMSGRPLPERIPGSWLERWQPLSPVPLPARFLDPLPGEEGAFPPIPRRPAIEALNRRTVDRLLGLDAGSLGGPAGRPGTGGR